MIALRDVLYISAATALSWFLIGFMVGRAFPG
jgi:hypothetical protein